MIKGFLTDFFSSSEPQVAKGSCYKYRYCFSACTKACVSVASIVQIVECITAGASEREQNPAGSEWVLLSGDRCPVGNLESPNCVLSETATAGAIILSLLNLSLSVRMCVCICVHTCVSRPMCVCVCVSFPCLESPRSLRELWKINTLRQLCLFIHLITHYHCITVPLISHHRA